MRMTVCLRTWVAGALAAFVAVCGQAQDLKTMKGIYGKSAEEIRAGFQPKFDALQQQYRKSLEALKTSARNRGDLITTKAAIAEIDRFQKAKSLPAAPDDNEIPEIKAFQSAYVTQYSKLEIDMTVQLGALTTKYEQALDRLQKELTKADKLDEATAVMEERKETQAAIKGYAETLAALRGPAATNTTHVAAARTPAHAPLSFAAKKDLYMVIDLSRGTKAKEYPVKYLADVPKGGWDDEYKTDKLVLRKIEAGTFVMGSPEDEVGREDDEKQHEVKLTKEFYIGVFEVTQKQWELVSGDFPSGFNNPKYRDARPVETVNYNDIRGAVEGAKWPASDNVDATSFLGRLRLRTGKAFDLPTEAQWEYACRAGTVTALNNGKILTEVGRCKANSGDGLRNGDTAVGTAKVGSYLPNAWGLYDMHGNVWEWCVDWLGNYTGTESDPKGPTVGTLRVLRGGTWNGNANLCRSANRDWNNQGKGFVVYGFRAALTLP